MHEGSSVTELTTVEADVVTGQMYELIFDVKCPDKMLIKCREK